LSARASRQRSERGTLSSVGTAQVHNKRDSTVRCVRIQPFLRVSKSGNKARIGSARCSGLIKDVLSPTSWPVLPAPGRAAWARPYLLERRRPRLSLSPPPPKTCRGPPRVGSTGTASCRLPAARRSGRAVHCNAGFAMGVQVAWCHGPGATWAWRLTRAGGSLTSRTRLKFARTTSASRWKVHWLTIRA